MDDDKLQDLIAMVYYDNQSKSILLNVSGFKNATHGKTVADWMVKKLNIDTSSFDGEGIRDNYTSLH